MNVYMIRDGGDDRLWKAETMQQALQLSEDAYIAENELPDTQEEREQYRNEFLESCTLIGELANP